LSTHLADTTDENGPNGCEWLPVDQIENLMIEELGYEDQPEFEDALRGTFGDFLDALPHVSKKTENGRCAGFVFWGGGVCFFGGGVCVVGGGGTGVDHHRDVEVKARGRVLKT
jgi:hypothetical protein